MTTHIAASMGDFAPVVIMPGDPMRSRMIAENFLSSPRLVNNVRGVQGYSGTYLGTPVSVMAHGMGMPSMAIYAHELFEFFGVQVIIRVGSAGGLADSLKLRDIILASSANASSNIMSELGLEGNVFYASKSLIELAEQVGAEQTQMQGRLVKGKVFTSDLFYDLPVRQQARKADGVLGVDMETAMLYAQAKLHGTRALSLLTVSDLPLTGEHLAPHDTERTFTDMIKVSMEIARKL